MFDISYRTEVRHLLNYFNETYSEIFDAKFSSNKFKLFLEESKRILKYNMYRNWNKFTIFPSIQFVSAIKALVPMPLNVVVDVVRRIKA